MFFSSLAASVSIFISPLKCPPPLEEEEEEEQGARGRRTVKWTWERRGRKKRDSFFELEH